MIVFCWGTRMSFWSRPLDRDFKLIRMRQQSNHLSHEIQTLQPHFKIFDFLNFCKIFLGCENIHQKVSLDAKI
jgi:hypothetical protein